MDFIFTFWCNGDISDSVSGELSFSSKANGTSSHFRTQRYLLLLGFWTWDACSTLQRSVRWFKRSKESLVSLPSSACMYRMKCALLVKISAPWAIFCLPTWPWVRGAAQDCERAGLPPASPRERAAPSARSGCAGRWKLRRPSARRGTWRHRGPGHGPLGAPWEGAAEGSSSLRPNPTQTARFPFSALDRAATGKFAKSLAPPESSISCTPALSTLTSWRQRWF